MVGRSNTHTLPLCLSNTCLMKTLSLHRFISKFTTEHWNVSFLTRRARFLPHSASCLKMLAADAGGWWRSSPQGHLYIRTIWCPVQGAQALWGWGILGFRGSWLWAECVLGWERFWVQSFGEELYVG